MGTKVQLNAQQRSCATDENEWRRLGEMLKEADSSLFERELIRLQRLAGGAPRLRRAPHRRARR